MGREKKNMGIACSKNTVGFVPGKSSLWVALGKYCCKKMFGSIYLDVCVNVLFLFVARLWVLLSCMVRKRLFQGCVRKRPWKWNATFTQNNIQPFFLPPPLPVSAALALLKSTAKRTAKKCNTFCKWELERWIYLFFFHQVGVGKKRLNQLK